MPKQTGHKYQLEQELIKRDWEIVEIAENTDWWDDEHWVIQFKYDADKRFFLCFIVDPQFEGVRKKGQGVYEIVASIDFPTGWSHSGFASISMTTRKFNVKLEKFLLDLESFKKSKK